MTPCDTRPCPICRKPFSPTADTRKPRRACSEGCTTKLRKRVAAGLMERPAPVTRLDALPDAPAREEEMGPPWPLLTPPDVQERERAAFERRVLQAWADGTTYEGILERFGHVGAWVLRTAQVERPGLKSPAPGLPT
jgi:hypothetical protein